MVSITIGIFGLCFFKAKARVQAIHDWNGEIHKNQIGFEMMCLFDRILSIFRFATYLQVFMSTYEIAQGPANHFAVIGDQN